jgi:CRISPR-associated endonuclease/helicase Cas3
MTTRYNDIETADVLLLKQGLDGSLEPWVADDQFAIALSTVKVSKGSFADKLMAVPSKWQGDVERLEKRYSQIKYLQCWMPELDAQFAYDEKLGFHEKSPA